MSETEQQAVEALNRMADQMNAIAVALDKLADVYLYCNHPEPEEGEEPRPGQSLSDIPRGIGMGMDQ